MQGSPISPPSSSCGTVGELERLLAPVQQVCLRSGYRHTFVGGSSAPAILDALGLGEPLELRDLDLYLIRGEQVQVEHLLQLVEALEPGPVQIRVKRRANPALPDPARLQYVTGYGAHLFRAGWPTLSLSVLHSEADHARRHAAVLGGLARAGS